MRTLICAKCSYPMEQGLILDHASAGFTFPLWADGSAERHWWHGLKVEGRRRLRVITFRCPNCSYLESYAPDEQEA